MKLKFLILSILCVASGCATSDFLAQEGSQNPKETTELRGGFVIPNTWTRRGLVLERQKDANGSGVSGDPCIVWDEDITGARSVEDLPETCRAYLDYVSDFLGVPIVLIGVGPERSQVILLGDRAAELA